MRLVLLAACMRGTTDKADTDTTTPSATTFACGTDEVAVSFTTEDDVTLAADYWPATSADAPVVVLFHMIPPNFDRSSYPKRFRRTLHDAGYAVLNVDRRGAGDSAGTAQDAYEGPGGRLDAEAAVGWVTSTDRACRVDSAKLALIGASNGTTTVFDYTVAAKAGLPKPVAVVLMSPGTYTENQHAFDAGWDLSFPFLWLYPTDEPYSLDFVADAPGAWEFIQRGDQHGTQMFDGGTLEDDTVADITRVLGAAL